MLVVVVDSATAAITAALAEVSADTVELRAQRVTVDARAHGELLAPAIRDVLAEGGVGVRDLGAVVAGVGPGPFTGLRVGLVTAASLSDTLGIPAYSVCTLDALGRVAGPGRVLVATDARRREVYWAVYQDGYRLTGPAVNRPADIDVTGVERAVGEGALIYAEVLGLPVVGAPAGGAAESGAGLRYPPALALADLAATRIRAGAPSEPLTPLYLRRPDAVEPGPRKSALR